MKYRAATSRNCERKALHAGDADAEVPHPAKIIKSLNAAMLLAETSALKRSSGNDRIEAIPRFNLQVFPAGDQS